MKLALADRDEHVTDIDHMRIDPYELASKAWAATRRAEIDLGARVDAGRRTRRRRRHDLPLRRRRATACSSA